MKTANLVFMILSGLLVFRNFALSLGMIIMGSEQTLAILIPGLTPLIIWVVLLVLSQKKKVNTSFTFLAYIGLTVLLGIHFYLLTTDISYIY